MLDKVGDFPGVASQAFLPIMKRVCPDPAPLLRDLLPQ